MWGPTGHIRGRGSGASAESCRAPQTRLCPARSLTSTGSGVQRQGTSEQVSRTLLGQRLARVDSVHLHSPPPVTDTPRHKLPAPGRAVRTVEDGCEHPALSLEPASLSKLFLETKRLFVTLYQRGWACCRWAWGEPALPSQPATLPPSSQACVLICLMGAKIPPGRVLWAQRR